VRTFQCIYCKVNAQSIENLWDLIINIARSLLCRKSCMRGNGMRRVFASA
jgi:hypothetical protein